MLQNIISYGILIGWLAILLKIFGINWFKFTPAWSIMDSVLLPDSAGSKRDSTQAHHVTTVFIKNFDSSILNNLELQITGHPTKIETDQLIEWDTKRSNESCVIKMSKIPKATGFKLRIFGIDRDQIKQLTHRGKEITQTEFDVKLRRPLIDELWFWGLFFAVLFTLNNLPTTILQ